MTSGALTRKLTVSRGISTAVAVAAPTAALYLGWRALKPWMTGWGASEEERAAHMPGEELLDHPKISTTFAITIEAEPARIWPWLMQLGQGRGGLYSYDWVERLPGFHLINTDRLLPHLRTLKVGDPVYLHPDAKPLKVTRVERERTLALGRWIFQLQPISPRRTRLISRTYTLSARRRKRLTTLLAKSPLGDLLHLTFARKQLKLIKALAESTSEEAARAFASR